MDFVHTQKDKILKYRIKSWWSQVILPIGILVYFTVYPIDMMMLLYSAFFSYCIFAVLMTNTHFINTHKLIKIKSTTLRFILNFFSTAYIVTPTVSWALIHYMHHRYVDTELDPHSPKHRGFFKVMWYSNHKFSLDHLPPYQQKKCFVSVQHLMNDPAAIFFEKYFVLTLAVTSIGFLSAGLDYFVYFYAIPVLYFVLGEMLGILNHSGKIGGKHIAHPRIYHNAHNFYWGWWLIPFEALHANHHNGHDKKHPLLKILKKLDK